MLPLPKFLVTYNLHCFFLCIAVPTAAPLTPSGYPLTSSLIRITWSPPPAEHINGIIDSYLVEMTEVVTNNTFVFYSTQTHINAGPLHPYYMYRCRVRASTIGPGPYTDFFNVQSGEAGVLLVYNHCCQSQRPTSSY